jgi:hypothetical protein
VSEREGLGGSYCKRKPTSSPFLRKEEEVGVLCRSVFGWVET